MVAENQTRAAFSQTLLAFDKAVGPGDTAFFFYAGHGFEIAGQVLLPTDVPPATEGQEELVRDASVLADRIIERMQNKMRTAILVFDACRNNPFRTPGHPCGCRWRRSRADDAIARRRVLDLFSRAPGRPRSIVSPTMTAIPIRCSREPSPNSSRSRARTWSRSRSARGVWSANWRRRCATSRSRSISTRWSTTCS